MIKEKDEEQFLSSIRKPAVEEINKIKLEAEKTINIALAENIKLKKLNQKLM